MSRQDFPCHAVASCPFTEHLWEPSGSIASLNLSGRWRVQYGVMSSFSLSGWTSPQLLLVSPNHLSDPPLESFQFVDAQMYHIIFQRVYCHPLNVCVLAITLFPSATASIKGVLLLLDGCYRLSQLGCGNCTWGCFWSADWSALLMSHAWGKSESSGLRRMLRVIMVCCEAGESLNRGGS